VYTWVASLLFIAVCSFWQPVPGRLYALTGGWALLGYALQLAAIVLTLRGASAVDLLDLAGVRPVLLAGRGAAPSHVPLATSGLYGFVRHPRSTSPPPFRGRNAASSRPLAVSTKSTDERSGGG
jgi:hypothetical protein